jgi:tetratricopeptide (TPR) repeat protein
VIAVAQLEVKQFFEAKKTIMSCLCRCVDADEDMKLTCANKLKLSRILYSAHLSMRFFFMKYVIYFIIIIIFLYFRKGDIYFLAKKYAEAVMSYNAAIGENFFHPDFLVKRCEAYEQMEMWNTVIDKGKHLLSLYPNYAIGM